MNSLLIDAFIAIAEKQSISRAAEVLYLSQSTVSHRLKLLEEEIGCALFHRQQGKRDILLTEQGESFLPLARQWALLEKDVATFRETSAHQTITVGAVDSLTQFFLHRLFNRIVKDGTLHLNVRTHATSILYNRMSNNTIDVAFTTEYTRYKNISTVQLFQEEMALICPVGWFPEGSDVDPAALDPALEVAVSWEMSELQLWHDQWWSPAKQPFVSINSPAFALNFLRHHAVWAVVPLSIGYYFQEQHPLGIHSLRMPPPRRRCYMMKPRHPRADHSAVVDVFQQYLDEYLDAIEWIDRS